MASGLRKDASCLPQQAGKGEIVSCYSVFQMWDKRKAQVSLPAMTEKLNVGGEAGRNRAATTEIAFWNICWESPPPHTTHFNTKN
jgi:hypothetical protein